MPADKCTPRTRGMQRLAAHALLGVSLLVAAACGSVDGEAGSDNGKTIAISFPNFSRTPALQVEMAAAEEQAADLGYTLLLDDPGADLDKQVSTVRTWIPQQYGAIIAVALDAAVLNGLAGQVMETGTKWITYGSKLENQTGEIDMQQVASGEMLAKLAGDWFNETRGGDGTVAILGYEEAQWARDRRAALETKLAEVAPGVAIVARQDALSETEGLDATKNLLQAHPDLNAILAVSESASVGAYSALPDKFDPTMFIGGMDGTREAIDAIAAGGAYRGSAALDLPAVGAGMVRAAVNSVTGEGEPSYRVTYIPVTPDSPELAQAQRIWG